MGRLPDPFQDEGSMRLEHPLAVSAHLARRDQASFPLALRPLHHRGNRNPEPRCNRSTAFTTQNRSNDTLTQIMGKSSGHQMLASGPASILNHNSPIGGIPSVSNNLGNALVHPARFTAFEVPISGLCDRLLSGLAPPRWSASDAVSGRSTDAEMP